MTSCSTVIALGMMPFTLWAYSYALDTGDLVIPFDKIALSIVSITLPVFGGLLVKWKLPRVAYICTKADSLKRTIALECGIQNVGTAFTVLSLSFPFEAQGNLTIFPMLFGFSQLGICCLVCFCYRIKKWCQVHLGKATSREEQNESPEEMNGSRTTVPKCHE
ncbi:solute carrier family 10 member 6-like isoform X3 [Limulus polyphemus]|uniref:Solute carrier family 10 member 6-like isoform X3 n=1 Tax=Limulus polyphemus TaxID=6850 RepID=A0ABM1RZ44_LIMPO|nr:solute carrier family 10 member 6-like isoform X3 [Limulus polyphemus]